MARSEHRPPKDIETIESPLRAGVLLRPLRLRILSLAREPLSATELARRLGLPRQRIHYHVRALEKAGFLRPAGRVRKRNLIEQRFASTARSYVLSPEVLGPVAADWRAIENTSSTDYVLALSEQVRSDLARAAKVSGGEGGAVEAAETLSLKSQFRFESPRQRAEFASAARRALVEAIARHTMPAEGGRTRRGRLYRLVLSCYPAPEPAPEAPEGGGE